MVRRALLKLICEKTTSYRGSASFVAPQQVRRVHTRRPERLPDVLLRPLLGKPQWVEAALWPPTCPKSGRPSWLDPRQGQAHCLFTCSTKRLAVEFVLCADVAISRRLGERPSTGRTRIPGILVSVSVEP